MPRNRARSQQSPPDLIARLNKLGLALHDAAYRGDTEEVVMALRRSTDPNLNGPGGWTPLLCAVEGGHADVVRILLDSGGKVSTLTEDGLTALHVCASTGNRAVAEMLVKAGANLTAANCAKGPTPLHIAAETGHSEVMTVLIEAGSSLNRRTHVGDTPLYISCENGRLDAVRVLLRAGADPLLASTDTLGQPFLPLEIAAFRGHPDVVRELLQQLGVQGCGGPSGGVSALKIMAQTRDLRMMTILTDAGVVDTGEALIDAAAYGGEVPVRFLLQWRRQQLSGDIAHGDAYVNARDYTGKTALISGVLRCRWCSPRVVRMLVDAGADTASAVRLTSPEGDQLFHGTPLAFLKAYGEGRMEEDPSEETKNILEAIRRLLLRVEAIHAASWLWHTRGDASAISQAAEGTCRARNRTAAAAAATTPLARMLPLLRRRANRRGVVLAPLFRRSSKA